VVRLDRLLAKVPGAEHAHGGHNHQAPASDELPGNIDQPMELVSSPDGTAFVTTLLDGVTLEGVSSGNLKYVDLHAAESEDSPTLACADLDEGN